ncbi:RNA polymerase sigma-70 factor [Pedobacter sp. ASV12]|uniref:RNA polymerase sigma-70 factor n=1 Tax=Pedobacter sp. ASV12 TaxID=2795120 RepID=UPI0018EDB823|nr:RNA polymerase sigma-70 factor [Pedobacter sp. ASV12]
MRLDTFTDSQLVGLLKEDNRDAFTEIYHRYSQDLARYTVASSRLHDLDEASDILHDLFVWLWEKRQQLDTEMQLKSYLYAATRHRIIDHIRKNSHHQRYAAFLQALATSYAQSADQQLEAKELQKTLEDSLAKLSPRIQEIYRLSRHEHLSVKQIAEKLGITEQTVKNQLTTALKYLKEALPVLAFLLMK